LKTDENLVVSTSILNCLTLWFLRTHTCFWVQKRNPCIFTVHYTVFKSVTGSGDSYHVLCHSQSHFATDGRSVSQSVSQSISQSVSQSLHLGIELLWDSWPDFGCSQDSCGDVRHAASSLTGGWVCHITGHSLCLYWQYIHMYFFFFTLQQNML